MKKYTLFLILACSFSVLFAQNKEIDSLKKVLPTYTQSDSNYINTLNVLAFKYYTINPDTTLILAEKSISLSDESHYEKGQVEALKNKGLAFYVKGDYAQALKIYLQAISLAEKIGYKKGIAKLYNNIANIYMEQGKYPEALETHLKSLKINKEIGNKQGVAISFNNIANIYSKQDKYPESLETYAKSLKIFEETGSKQGIANSLNNIAIISEKQGRYPEALENYFKSLKISEEIGDKILITYTKNGLAKVYLALKNDALALKYAQEALELAKEIGEKLQIRDINETLSKIYKATGKYELALLHYEQFKIYADSLNNLEIEKKTANLQAQYEFDKKTAQMQAEQAKKDIEQEVQKKQLYGLIFLAFAGLLSVLIILFLIFRSRKKIQNAYGELAISNAKVQQAKEEIETQAEELQVTNNALQIANYNIQQKNENITASINYALRIQNAIIPKEQEIQKYFPESFVLFRPKDIVSGDFYWFADKITDTGNKKIIVVADCTGHGVSGAFMTMIGNNMLNHIIHDQEITQPNEILNLMTPLLEKTLLHSEGKVKDGMDISIISIHPKGFQNPSGVVIEYAGAMNPLYYVENQEFKEIKADKVPIGGKQKEGFSYQLFQLSVNSNQLSDEKKLITDYCTLYLCTDGFQDQFGGENNKKFMVKNLKKLLFEISENPMVEQKQVLETTLDAWISSGNETQTDDICVLGIRI